MVAVVVIILSSLSKCCVCLKLLQSFSTLCDSVDCSPPGSCVLWTVAHQVPVSMGFSRQEYWSGLTCPPLGGSFWPGDLNPHLMFPALADRFLITITTWEAIEILSIKCPNLTPQDGKNLTLPSPQSGWWTYSPKHYFHYLFK